MSSCVHWALYGTRGPLKRSLNLPTAALKSPIYTRVEYDVFFCSTSPLKAPNRLKSLKLA
jgi:hypothetical protein